jgi:hypothetical protein
MYRGPVPAESETQPYEDLPTGARIEIHTQYIVITLKDGISLIGPHWPARALANPGPFGRQLSGIFVRWFIWQ